MSVQTISTATRHGELIALNSESVHSLLHVPPDAVWGGSDREGSIIVWDAASRRVRATLTGHTAMVNSLAYLAPVSRPPGHGAALRHPSDAPADGASAGASSVASSPAAAASDRHGDPLDGAVVWSGSWDSTVRIWGTRETPASHPPLNMG